MSGGGPGWDDAEFVCGRCPTRFHAGTLTEYVSLHEVHEQVHDAAEVLGRLGCVPARDCLRTAAALVRAVVLDVSPAAEGVLRPAWSTLVTSG